MKRRITSIIMAVLVLAASLLMPMTGILAGANTENILQTWDFGGFENGNHTGMEMHHSDTRIRKWFPSIGEYTTEISKLTSADGKVVLGSNNAYWNLAKYWNINNGSLTFNSAKYPSDRHAFVMSFKLDKDLKANMQYTLITDMTLSLTGEWFQNFCVYYADTLAKASSGAETQGKAPDGTTTLFSKYSPMGNIPAQSFTFTPAADLAAGGYISIRFFVKAPTTLTVNIKTVQLLDVTLDDSFAGYWNFKGFAEGDYKGDNVVKEYASNDGKVIMGINNAWWQQWKTFNIKDSKMTFTSKKYPSGYHQFVLSLRLDSDLEAGMSYRLDTDLAMGAITGANSPKEFYVYYSPTKDNSQRTTAKPKVNGHFIIHETAGGFSTLPATSFEFTPTSDLAKGGYIHIRFNLTSVEPVTVTMSEAWILKLDPNNKNKVVNNSFEISTKLWDADEAITVTDEAAKDGKHAVKLGDSYYKKLSQKVAVEPNKNYEFSFWYKGTVSEKSAIFAVSKDKTFKAESVLARGTVASAEEWTEFKTVFSSGDNTSVNLVFQTLPELDLLIDQVSLQETDAAADEYKSGVSPVITFANPNRTGYSSTIVVSEDEFNQAVNYSLENNKSDNENDFAAVTGKTAAVIEDENAFDGAKSLKFTAGEERESLSVPLKLQPETEYVFTFFIKAEATKWETDNSKFTNLTFGISDIYTGEYVLMPDNKTFATALNGDLQFVVPAYDSEWHITSFRFRTDSNGEAVFLAKGRNVNAWFDNFYVFEPEYGIQYQTPAQKLENMEITDEAPELLGIKDENYNLVDNSNLAEGNTFWKETKSTLLGSNLEISDSKHNIQKDSFHYASNRRYPFESTYIRWIDVKPNTEYTFSAKLLISKTGNGYFGLAQGYKTDKYTVTDNLVTPTKLKLYYFTKENFDYNCNWQNIGFTFNTKNRNRVGIVLSDAGGEAYVDDIKLFETKNASKLITVNDNFPNKLVSKNKNVKISDGYISGIPPKTAISKVISNFENKQYIRVFDRNGNEITDLSAKSSTGIEIRLMNGPVIKARAFVIIKGDVNGDGILNSDDKNSLFKHLTLEKEITDKNFLKAADYDGDGEITVHDLLWSNSKPTKSETDISFKGPEKFDSGSEIKVTLAVEQKNIKAVSGKLRFKSDKLSLVSIKSDIKDWNISYITGKGEIFFAAASMGNTLPQKGKNIVTLTFKVGNINSYSDAAIELYELIAAAEGELFTATAVWNNDIAQNGGSSDSGSEDNTGGQNVYVPGTTITTTIEESVEVKNRLSILKLDEADLSPEFNAEVQEYTATVPFKVEKVTVTAIAESEDATVNIGDTNLEYVGKNKVDIVVLSAEGMQRTYRIIITREPPEKRVITVGGFPTWAIILICVGAALLVAGATFFVIVLIKRKRKAKN